MILVVRMIGSIIIQVNNPWNCLFHVRASIIIMVNHHHCRQKVKIKLFILLLQFDICFAKITMQFDACNLNWLSWMKPKFKRAYELNWIELNWIELVVVMMLFSNEMFIKWRAYSNEMFIQMKQFIQWFIYIIPFHWPIIIITAIYFAHENFSHLSNDLFCTYKIDDIILSTKNIK